MPRFIQHLKTLNKKSQQNGGAEKYTIPEDFLDKWKEAKKYYLEAMVADPSELNVKWNSPQRDALINFMVGENEFNRDIISGHVNELKILHNRYRKIKV